MTERRVAEERLRASEERYRTLFEAMDAGFCIVEVIFDAQSRPVDFLEVNPAFQRQTGLTGAVGSNRTRTGVRSGTGVVRKLRSGRAHRPVRAIRERL